ncbi:MAG: class IV adenylate cyclase [Pyrinomonadaceae bacterium]|nr:class IV adenylate cyclase [Pyrinomonadaceae bacterium]
MNSNIELKAKARKFSEQIKIANELSESPQDTLLQEDTFFFSKNGRLKLRKFSESRGELIIYQRPDKTGAKQSSYEICPTRTPEVLKNTLSLALGVIGVVRKTRYLFFHGQTRIHLDVVNDLGQFIEFEYVLQPDEAPENGQIAVDYLKKRFGIRRDDLISHSYIDLLLSEQ